MGGVGEEQGIQVTSRGGQAVGLEGVHYFEKDKRGGHGIVKRGVEMAAVLWAKDFGHGIENALEVEGVYQGSEFIVTQGRPEEAGELAGVEPRAPFWPEGLGRFSEAGDNGRVGPEVFEEVVFVGGIVCGKGAAFTELDKVGPL